jgi:hypothetical protein
VVLTQSFIPEWITLKRPWAASILSKGGRAKCLANSQGDENDLRRETHMFIELNATFPRVFAYDALRHKLTYVKSLQRLDLMTSALTCHSTRLD